jgi:Secretion system C-terminal sorting domain
LGCTNPGAANYDSQATVNYGCYVPVPGCTNVTAFNYNPGANTDDGSCDFVTALPGEPMRSLRVYPNPMHEEFTITPGAGTDFVELFDARGRKVFQSTVGTETTFRPVLAPGMYYYRLSNHYHVIETGKIIKR